MNKKVLIYFPNQLKEHYGGPYSYLYHLKHGLSGNIESIIFYTNSLSEEGENIKKRKSQTFLKKIIKKFIPKYFITNYRAKKWIKEISSTKINIDSDFLNEFSLIHFHESIDIWRLKELLTKYKGKIIFTPHTPKPYHLELINDVWNVSKNEIKPKYLNKIIEIDQIAYSLADTYIYPCPESAESTYQLWSDFSNISKNKNFEYVLTGIKEQITNKTREEIRDSLNIPNNAFVVCFSGRKIPVKGYDLLVEAANFLLANYPDIYFVIAGKESSNPPNNKKKWIETGWTDFPQDYMNASDIIIVPNRYTFFDLSVLEALSLGKTLLLSETGGNNYFKKFNSPGIHFHTCNAESIIEQVLHIYELKDKLGKYENVNKSIFENYFLSSIFAKNIKKIYASIS